ncbi:MAG: 50S ribosomal protein L24 [Bacilli bacterium]
MKVKVGDTVKIITGKDKGKSGKVIKTMKLKNKVVIDGLNLIKKHSKPNNTNDKGGIFEIEAPIHVSNVKVITESEVKEIKKAEKAKPVKVKEEKVEAKEVVTKSEKAPVKKASKKASK